MNLLEFQAKRLLERFGVPAPPCRVVAEAADVRPAVDALALPGVNGLVVKAQIHAGGRGRGTFRSGRMGGVRVCAGSAEAEECARAMLGDVLVTGQTGPEGRRVRRVLIAQAVDLRAEYYLAVVLDRSVGRPVVIASPEGGMDIEEVAARTPDRVFRETVDPALGLQPYQARKLAVSLGLRGDLLGVAVRLMLGVYGAWWECDASLIEINPLGRVRSVEGAETLMAVDAKMSLDDNGLYRHPDLAALRDLGEESPLEIRAGEQKLSYIQLDGSIACLVNGAGLAMATMDIIKHCGGRPANFMDVGGGASQAQVTNAFSLILEDPKVRAILVNIFGGIMDCDVIAQGIVAAVRAARVPMPLVVRLEGNNVEAGRRTLEASGLALETGNSMGDAAEKAVAAAGRWGKGVGG
ncbi:MAG TPA: ADP-forming succinate--CoA ligase subunit beta [Verrucomicrobiota bacterium]|nr:ADP-forming succinate--CoA ligase subunit beta [Verrucomicrobiota bacterium]HNU52367.1 ADP-forming succinate--CoA ligase subunit beta [Verrucomicrobiota bacterium]